MIFKGLISIRIQRKKSSSYELSDEEIALIKKHNKEDFKLYEYALTRFERQKLAIESDTPFIRFGKTNMAKSDEGKMMKGWAADYDSQSPVAIEVHVGKKKIAELSASEYRSTANERNIHRNGFIGFSFLIQKSSKMVLKWILLLKKLVKFCLVTLLSPSTSMSSLYGSTFVTSRFT